MGSKNRMTDKGDSATKPTEPEPCPGTLDKVNGAEPVQDANPEKPEPPQEPDPAELQKVQQQFVTQAARSLLSPNAWLLLTKIWNEGGSPNIALETGLEVRAFLFLMQQQPNQTAQTPG